MERSTIVSVGLMTVSVLLFTVMLKKKNDMNKRVTELWIYPIKGCKGYQVNSAKITKRGLQYDRLLMCVDGKGKFISQRTHPKMALIVTEIDEEKEQLTLSTPDCNSIVIDLLNRDGDSLTVTVWGTECIAIDMGDDANRWFCKFLDTEGLRLVHMDDGFKRSTGNITDGETGFADQTPFLLATVESLQAVRDTIKPSTSKIITMENFRPNVVIKGFDAFEEDAWKMCTIGSNRFEYIFPCARCKVPTNDPTTGILDRDNQPTKAMNKFRTGKIIGYPDPKLQGHVFFGVHLEHNGVVGTIAVGDLVVGL